MSDEIKMQGESIMNEPKNRLTEKEMKFIEDTEAFMDEVYNNPEVADAEPSSVLRKRVFAEIRAREVAKKEEVCAEEKVKETDSKVEKLGLEEEINADKFGMEEKAPEVEKLSAEEKELIRLGRIYKKRKRLQKYVVLAAVLILAMVFGMTSVGGPKKVFERIKYVFSNIDQTNVDSEHEDVVRTSGLDEEEAYRKIEEKFGFAPVGLGYLPKDAIFLDSTINEETQCINLVYGEDDEVLVGYFIRPNYRLSSYGKDIEDEFIEEYSEENEYTTFLIRKYLVEGVEERWSVQFDYCDVSYSLTIYDTSKGEVNQIVENLIFS